MLPAGLVFQKNARSLAFFIKEPHSLALFCFLYKRKRVLLCSFAFFVKECAFSCVLLLSFACSFWFHKKNAKERGA